VIASLPAARIAPASDPLRAVFLLAVLAGAVAVRVALKRLEHASAFTAGALFGGGLIVAAIRFGGRTGRPRAASVALGVVGGAILVGLPGWLSPLPAIGLGLHPEPFAAWVVVTVLVAIGEEAVLRGVLFDAVAATLGRPGAVLVTSVAFALLHVPLYGWPRRPAGPRGGHLPRRIAPREWRYRRARRGPRDRGPRDVVAVMPEWSR